MEMEEGHGNKSGITGKTEVMRRYQLIKSQVEDLGPLICKCLTLAATDI